MCDQKKSAGTADVAQRLREHTALLEDPGSVPNTHVKWLPLPVTPAPWNQMPSLGLQGGTHTQRHK